MSCCHGAFGYKISVSLFGMHQSVFGNKSFIFYCSVRQQSVIDNKFQGVLQVVISVVSASPVYIGAIVVKS